MEESVAKPREKYFFSYPSAVKVTGVCRRTLCRWMDMLDIEPLNFVDNDRAFITKPQIELLLEYKELLRARDPELLQQFKEGVRNENISLIERSRKGLKALKDEKERRRRGKPGIDVQT